LLLLTIVAAKSKKDLRFIFGSQSLPTPKPFALPKQVSDQKCNLVKALFQSDFTIELLNSPITLACGTFKALAVQNPDRTARVLDHPLGL